MFGTEKGRKVRPMSSRTITTHDTTAVLAEKLRGYGAKMLARIVGTSPDTTKKWLSASNAPTWKHTVIMLNDPELSGAVLEAAGRLDLVRPAETISHLMAAMAQLKEDADGKQQRINELIYLHNDIRSGRVRAADWPVGPEETGIQPGAGSSGDLREEVQPATPAVPRAR